MLPDEAQTIFTLSPADPLTANTKYKVVVLSGAKAMNGSSFATNQSFAFTTGTAILPKVSLIIPNTLNNDASRATNIILQFSEPMNIQTVTNENIRLQTTDGIDIPIGDILPGAHNTFIFYCRSDYYVIFSIWV